VDIIVLIIIIFVFRNKIQKSKGNTNTTVPNKPRNQNSYRSNQKRNVNQKKSAAAQKTVSNTTQTSKQQYKQMTMADVQQKEGESTTEYLRKKALQEKLDDKKEKMEQERKNQQVYGRMCYAGRWFEGDPVPDSRKVVKCGYCAAENLVPINDRTKYNCYFCREEL